MSETVETDAVYLAERERLRQVEAEMTEALKEAEDDVQRLDDEYREAQLYMVENRAEIDPREMFRTRQTLGDIDNRGVAVINRRDRLRKAKSSPYFARIDFAHDGGAAEPYYVGLYAFRRDKRLLVIDWRSPVASMFYDFELGSAGYDAPSGRVEGELVLKRQFKIENGELKYAFDSSQNIQDEILQQELAHTSDEKMKSIISTIQKEQNAVIRDEKSDVMIIQGTAGSGKTSIALHRVAFLLYRFRETIKAENVTIISPNKVFGSYISGVLPELGEEPIFEAGMEDLALIQLEEGIDFVGEKDPLEYDDAKLRERVRFKAGAEFVRLMDNYIASLPRTAFEARDYVCGDFTVPAGFIQERLENYRRYPMMKRLEEVADDVESRLLNEAWREEKPPKVAKILIDLKKMLRFRNTLALYKEFYRTIGRPDMYKPFRQNVLEWNDVYPYLYLQSYFTGVQETYRIKHLVIDEMQDYTPIQYAVLNRLFPCPKTILGDFGQSIDPDRRYSLEDLHGLYEGSKLVRLEKSYRSTWEITHFAKSIVGMEDFHAVERHGEAPEVISCESRGAEIEKIAGLIREFKESEYNSLGIVTRTNADAKALYDWLKELDGELDIELVTPESKSYKNGVNILSVRMSKGLEFDRVVVPFADSRTYRTEFDRNLLYVAATRAMHRLTLTCAGEPSKLLPGA